MERPILITISCQVHTANANIGILARIPKATDSSRTTISKQERERESLKYILISLNVALKYRSIRKMIVQSGMIDNYQLSTKRDFFYSDIIKCMLKSVVNDMQLVLSMQTHLQKQYHENYYIATEFFTICSRQIIKAPNASTPCEITLYAKCNITLCKV